MLTREIYLAILFSASFHVAALVYTDDSVSEVGDNIDNIIELHLITEMQPSLSEPKKVVKKSEKIYKKIVQNMPAFEQSENIKEDNIEKDIVKEEINLKEEDDNNENEMLNESSSVATVRAIRDKGYTIPKPKYPNLARKKGYEGVVKYRVILDDQLKIKDTILISSSGYNILDRAAKKSIQRGKFTAKVSEVDIIIRFRLTDVL